MRSRHREVWTTSISTLRAANNDAELTGTSECQTYMLVDPGYRSKRGMPVGSEPGRAISDRRRLDRLLPTFPQRLFY